MKKLWVVLTILQDDKYIEIEFSDERIKQGIRIIAAVRLKIRGKYFIHQGGYVGKSQRMDDIEKKVMRTNNRMVLLTVFLAVGAMGLLILEIYKTFFYHSRHFYHLWH